MIFFSALLRKIFVVSLRSRNSLKMITSWQRRFISIFKSGKQLPLKCPSEEKFPWWSEQKRNIKIFLENVLKNLENIFRPVLIVSLMRKLLACYILPNWTKYFVKLKYFVAMYFIWFVKNIYIYIYIYILKFHLCSYNFDK